MNAHLDLENPDQIDQVVRAALLSPEKVVAESKVGKRGGATITLRSRSRSRNREPSALLSRQAAVLAISGAGWFELRLDNVFVLTEVDDDSSFWVEIVSEMIGIAELYFEGAGRITKDGRGKGKALLTLDLKNSQVVLEGNLSVR
jgi:hypothetical protein